MEMTDAIARILQDIKVGYDNGDPVINSGEYAAICDILAEYPQQEGDIPDASPKVDPVLKLEGGMVECSPDWFGESQR